jgi:ADP-ribose pyrophosphatase YjhB (NUDIX family)
MIKFCVNCGQATKKKVPDGDDRPRDVCGVCGIVHYENPKMVVGCIPEWDGKILLCKRAIEPRYGKWTLPAGFMENGETVEEGARRETREEACARIEDLKPYAIFNLAFVSQVYMMFRARLVDLDFKPGPESLSVALFREEEIPWDQIAFTVIEKTLKQFFIDRKNGKYPFFIGNVGPSPK